MNKIQQAVKWKIGYSKTTKFFKAGNCTVFGFYTNYTEHTMGSKINGVVGFQLK